MPTLEDLAIKNARNLIRQWRIFEPDIFVLGYNGEPIGHHEPPGSLLDDIFKLSEQDINDWYPEFDILKHTVAKISDIPFEDLPWWQQDLLQAEKRTNELHREMGIIKFDEEVHPHEYLHTFWILCRARFNTLETRARIKKHLTPYGIDPRGRAPKKRKAEDEPDPTGAPIVAPTARKRRIGVHYLCDTLPPSRRGKRNLTCRICGYAVTAKAKKVNFMCCDKVAHRMCWDAQNKPDKSIVCTAVTKLLEKDKKTVFTHPESFNPDVNVKNTNFRKYAFKPNDNEIAASAKRTREPTGFSPEIVKDLCKESNAAPCTRDGFTCRACGEFCLFSDTDQENHLMSKCKALDKFASPAQLDRTPGPMPRSVVDRAVAVGIRRRILGPKFGEDENNPFRTYS